MLKQNSFSFWNQISSPNLVKHNLPVKLKTVMTYDPIINWAEGAEWRWWNWNFNLDSFSNELLIVLKRKKKKNKPHQKTRNKFLSFIRRSHLICLLPLGEEWMDQRFYMMFPACRTMLCWLQRNPCDGVRWGMLEQCLGLSLVSALWRETCHHMVLPQLHT